MKTTVKGTQVNVKTAVKGTQVNRQPPPPPRIVTKSKGINCSVFVWLIVKLLNTSQLKLADVFLQFHLYFRMLNDGVSLTALTDFTVM